ncbi:MAG: rhomboid family intramembrane serine protease [Bacilli bacterium]
MFLVYEDWRSFIKKHPITTLIAFISILLHIFIQLFPQLGGDIVFNGSLIPLFVANGEWWRLVTHGFIHVDFSHILMNMFFLIIFARPVEKMLGSVRFSAFIFLSLLGSGLMVYFTSADPIIPTIGLSGALYALMGMYLNCIFMRNNMLHPSDRQLIITFVLLNVVTTFIFSNVSIAGHLGGLVTGFLLTPLLLRKNDTFYY